MDRHCRWAVHLAQHVAGRKGHEGQGCRVPGAEDDAPVAGVLPQLPHHVGQLVNPLTPVVSMHVCVLCPKVTPLEAVHRSQIARLSAHEICFSLCFVNCIPAECNHSPCLELFRTFGYVFGKRTAIDSVGRKYHAQRWS